MSNLNRYLQRLLIGVVLLAMLLIPGVVKADVEHSVPPGPGEVNWSKPWAPDYVEGVPAFIDFEGLPEGQVLGEVIPGVKFTTTDGQDWLVGTWSSNNYNGKYPSGGAYTSQGDAWAWLGIAQGGGIIRFTEGKATYFSCLTSTYSGVQVDAYDEYDALIASSGSATNNVNTGTMDRVTVKSEYRNIQYVIVHDTADYWLIDCISTDAPGIGLELAVPHFRQDDPQWSADYIVDPIPGVRAGKTIGSIGCAMTSVTMILASYGMDSIDLGNPGEPDLQPLDPGTLNKWLKKHNGYSDGNIDWWKIDDLGYMAMGERGDSANYKVVNRALELRQPVILYVGGHFVVARGKYTYDVNDESKNYFVKNDPNSNATRVYHNGWYGYRLYEPSGGVVRPALRIIMRSPAEMLISDALGRRTGYDPISGAMLQEIPDSFYHEEGPIVDPETGEEGTTGYKELYIIDPDNGPYQLAVVGTGTGSYELDIANRDWSVQYANVTLHGTTSPGKVDGYLIDNSTTSAEDLTVTPTTIEALVTINPETLNLQALGKWITAYVELPEDYAVEDIDIGTVQLLYDGNVVNAAWGDVQDGVLMVKFGWATVAGWFEGLHDEEVELTVTGEVDGIQFEGTDTIRVMDPPRPGRGR